MKYRIVCNDDPFEETLYFENKARLESVIENWFGNGDGYPSVKCFNGERMGIHTAQIKKSGRWIELK